MGITFIQCGKCRSELPLAEFMPSQRKPGRWCRSCMRSWYVERSGGLVDRQCNHCSSVVNVTARRAAEPNFYCSRPCKERARRDAEIAARLAVKEAQPSRACPHCGDALAAGARTDAVYCSEQCNSAAHNATRKASWKVGSRQERVSRAYIIKRDGGRCHMCGCYPNGSELHLDHLVPLSRGGSHEPENLRVSCAPCNLSKRADARDEQLLLIG